MQIAVFLKKQRVIISLYRSPDFNTVLIEYICQKNLGRGPFKDAQALGVMVLDKTF